MGIVISKVISRVTNYRYNLYEGTYNSTSNYP